MTHEEPHRLDIVCILCVIEKNKKYEKLLEFVKYIALDSNYYRQTRELLKEIGEK